MVCCFILFQFLKRPTTFFFSWPIQTHLSFSWGPTKKGHICKLDLPPCSLSPPSHYDLAASRHPLPGGPLSPLMPLAALTHHDRDVKNVHLLLHYLRRLLEAGGGCPGELLGAAHGDMEVQGAVLQPLLLPVHQRNVSHSPRHLCRNKIHNWGSVFSVILKGGILSGPGSQDFWVLPLVLLLISRMSLSIVLWPLSAISPIYEQ